MLVQGVLVFAAPLSACRAANAAAAAHDDECCPAGSHPPGQCPRHAGRQSTPVACRMLCDAPHGFQFLTVVAGILPADAAIAAAPIEARPPAIAFVSPLHRTTIPDPPPPRRL